MSARINLVEYKGKVLSDHYGVRTLWDWKKNAGAVHFDSQTKRTKALVGLRKTIQFMKRSDSTAYEEIIAQLCAWETALQQNQVDANYYRVVMGFF